MPEARSVGVIGAGAVGMCCALYLQQEGHRVTVFDPSGAGEGASKSNAGLLTSSAVVPTAMPGVIRRVPKMLLDPLGPLTLRWRYLPRIAPWLLRFVLASRSAQVERISVALAGLVAQAQASYEPLWRATGTDHLIRREGLLIAYRSEAAFARGQEALQLRRRRGIELEVLEGEAVRGLEPTLDASVRYGVLYPRTAHTVDPRAMVSCFAEHFAREGGRLVRERVVGFDTGRSGPRAIRTDAGSHPVDVIVLAAGAWSRALASRLGARVPLDTERGYGISLPNAGVHPRIPIISPDLGLAVTPMATDLRLTGSVELAGLSAPPQRAQFDRIVRAARTLFPTLETAGASTWMGFRPSMPDSMPVIGRSPRYDNAFLAFGHGHDGLGLAAITGKVVAEMVAGRRPSVDATPFRPERFGPLT